MHPKLRGSIGWLCVGLCALPVYGWAQHISVGITAGVGLTDAFKDETIQQLNTHTEYSSGRKDYLVGPTVELSLPFNFSAEVDVLYRPLHLNTLVFSTVSPSFSSSTTVTSWEFPLLGKFRLPLPFHPLVEAGPTFRASSSSLADPSGTGFTFGTGLEVHLLKLKVSPQLRYTHWGSDSVKPAVLQPFTKQNQVEFLVGFTI
jgi:hypothetical protein